MTLVMYALMDKRPGAEYQPFYVGIGTKRRPAQHIRAAKSAKKHSNWRVQRMMDEHFEAGVLPEVKILVVCPDREYAWLIEKRYIAKLGRKDIDEGGILCNLGIGGEDVGSDLPHVKAAKSAAAKRLNKQVWSDPEASAARKAAMQGKKKTFSPEALEARRNNAKKASSPEANALKKEAAIKKWQDPEYRALMSLKRKQAWQDPEKRASMLANRSKGIAMSWLDDEIRQRRIEGIKNASRRAFDTGV